MEQFSIQNDATSFESFKLPNGIPIFFRKYDPPFSQPKFAASILVNVGGRDDPRGKEGAAHFFEHMPFRGTKQYPDLDRLTRSLENNGGYINAFTTDEATGYEMVLPQSLAPDGIGRLYDIVTSPLLRPDDIQLEREIIIEELKNKLANVQFYARQHLFRLLLGEHPLVYAVIGTESALRSLTPDELRLFHERFYNASNMALFFTGSLIKLDIENLLTSRFSNLKSGERTVRDQFITNPQSKKEKLVLEPRQYNRSVLMMGCVLPPLDVPLSIQYRFFRDMLTAGMNSPLQVEIREKRGLAYNLSLQVMTFQDVSLLVFSVATQFRHMPTIESIFWDEIGIILTNQTRFEEVKHMLRQTILHREYSVASLNDEAIDSYLDFGRIVSVKEIISEIENTTLSAVAKSISSKVYPKAFASVWVNCHEEQAN